MNMNNVITRKRRYYIHLRDYIHSMSKFGRNSNHVLHKCGNATGLLQPRYNMQYAHHQTELTEE